MRGGVWDMTSTCVQDGLPRPLGGYQANVIMEPHSPAPAWNMHQSVIPKQERMDDERNDSGINSGSDFHSSSPGSDNSQDYNTHVPGTIFTTPVSSQFTRPTFGFHLGFNPLTPPSGEPKGEPPQPESDADVTMTMGNGSNTTLTPHASPKMAAEDDPLRRLQMSCTLSPKPSEHSGDDADVKSEEPWDESEETGVRVPTVNTHGKVKKFKCKQCDYVAITKMAFWEHSKAHIKTDKILTCPKCPFVTEYKHHLEYHLRNHFGSKPFKCDKCSYTCVNKSMLNSHMKSHSNVYQYRCQECSYATKYCHSLKLHLRKYNHKPAMVLNPDGTPNPLPIIDVYGTRRGPKPRSATITTSSSSNNNNNKTEVERFTSASPPLIPGPVEQQAQNPFMTFMNFASQRQLSFGYPFFPGALGNQLLIAQQLAQQQAQQKQMQQLQQVHHDDEFDEEEEAVGGVLDLSKPDAPAKMHRRKGKAFKLDRSLMHANESDEEEAKNVKPEVQSSVMAESTCRYCGIAFGDVVLYTMHMGYHGYKDPFTCNMCGEQCNDKVAFFLHIARNPHT